ncbi:MAG: hypothetical protein ACR2MP_03050 [Streptosporangiaceae bacterium]
MSRGLGMMERVVLRKVRKFADRGVPATRRRIASRVFDRGPDRTAPFTPPSRVQMSSFHRAVRSLKGKGLLRETQWTNVLEVTESGDQALEALGGGPQRAKLDLQTVRGRGSQTAAPDGRSPANWTPPRVRAGTPARPQTNPQVGP